jgi:hypothetical protein
VAGLRTGAKSAHSTALSKEQDAVVVAFRIWFTGVGPQQEPNLRAPRGTIAMDPGKSAPSSSGTTVGLR